MLNRIVIPLIIAFVVIAIQLVVIPLISIQYVIPNVVLIFVVLYALRFGQISGMIFGFLVGLFFDLVTAGFLGSGMFAFTLSAFVAGYFSKDEYLEVLYNLKVFLPLILFVSTLFFLTYSILGYQNIEIKQNYTIFLYSLFCGIYTTVFSLGLFIIPKDKL
jgi:rod shape-determining protein MreD